MALWVTTGYQVQNRVPIFSLTTLYSLTHCLTAVFPQTSMTLQDSPEGRLSQTLQGKHIKKLLHARGKKKKSVINKKGRNVTTGKCAGTCLSQSNPCGILTFGVIHIPTFQWHYAIFCEVIRGSMF